MSSQVSPAQSQQPPATRGPRQKPQPRSSSLQKYRRIEKPREATPDDEIRVMGSGRVPRYVTYAAKLLGEMGRSSLTIRATGKAVAIAVSVCEVVKRRFKGLHQVTTIGWTEITDEYEPLEAGLEKRVEKRTVPSICVFLTKDESKVDKRAPGYQPPLDKSLVQDQQPDAFANVGQRPPRRVSRRGRAGRPRGSADQGKTRSLDATTNGEGRTDTRKSGRRRSSRKANKRGGLRTEQPAGGVPQSTAPVQVKV